jgi:hypothetical protein
MGVLLTPGQLDQPTDLAGELGCHFESVRHARHTEYACIGYAAQQGWRGPDRVGERCTVSLDPCTWAEIRGRLALILSGRSIDTGVHCGCTVPVKAVRPSCAQAHQGARQRGRDRAAERGSDGRAVCLHLVSARSCEPAITR